MDSFSVPAQNLSFLGTRPDSTICRYTNGFYHFPAHIWTVFRYSLGIYLFWELSRFYHLSILERILPFSGTHTDSFFGTRSESFFSWNWPGFYHFSILARILPFSVLILTVFRYSLGIFLFRELARILQILILARILPFSGTQRDSFLVLARILRFPGTRPDSTIFRDSPGFYHFPRLIWTVFRYLHEIFLFRELARILPFFDTRTDSTIFRYS